MKHLTPCERRDELLMGLLGVLWANMYVYSDGTWYIPLVSVSFSAIAAFGVYLNGSFLYSPVIRSVGMFGLAVLFALIGAQRYGSAHPDYASYFILSVLYLKVTIGAVRDSITTLRSYRRWRSGSG